MNSKKNPQPPDFKDATEAGQRSPWCPWESLDASEESPRNADAIAGTEAESSTQSTEPGEHGNARPFHVLLAGFEALDLLNVGLAVTNAWGRLLMANRSFEQLLATGDGLELSADGILAVQAGRGPALSEMVRRVSGAGGAAKASRSETIVAVNRSAGKRALTLQVRPVKAVPAHPRADAPSVLVFVLDPDLAVGAADAELRQLYGLTSTEARLANLLMEGKTMDECCQELDVRRSTCRTHLQHLFDKVGVQRQSELVSVLWKSIGLVRTQKSSSDLNLSLGEKSGGVNDAMIRMLMRAWRDSNEA